MAIQKDLVSRIEYGGLRVYLNAQGTPYNPDVLDDLVRRTSDLWNNAVKVAIESGLMDHDFDDDDDNDEEDEDSKDDE